MKDIALIIPNNPFLANERTFPNIGVLRVATKLINEGYSVDVLDFSGKKTEDIIPYANQYKYFGFSSVTPQFPYVMKMFNCLKKENPKAKTIIGGAHPTALYSLKQKGIKDINIKDLEVFDTIFIGEGEDITNLFKSGWQKSQLIKDLDETPIPNRDLIDIKSYHYNLFGKNTTCILTQRGCPFQCAFCCGRDIEMYNRTRMHSPERVLQELDELNKKYGYTSFMWYDDEINVNVKRLEELCKLLATRKYQHRGFVRSDMICKYPESVKWLKDAGFVKLCTGVESGSDRMLKNINKGITIEQHTKAAQLIKDTGIHYEAFMMIGFPDETLEDVMMTKDWLIKNKPDDFDLGIITPYPGSRIYDNAKPSTKFKDYKWEYNGMYFNKPRYSKEDSFYRGYERESRSNIRTNKLSHDDIVRLQKEVTKEVKECLNIK